MGARIQGGLRGAFDALTQAARQWGRDRAPEIAAALAYYTLFSVAPILVLATAVAGAVYGRSGGSRVLAMVSSSAGPRVAQALQQILISAADPRTGAVASFAGIVTLIVGATGAFGSVQSALNRIWGVRPRSGRGVWGVVRDRLPPFLLLLALGALVVLSLAADAVLTVLARALPRFGPMGVAVTEAGNFLLFVVVGTMLFALVFKVLPDAGISLRDVWAGAFVTAVLFALGQLLVGLYLTFVSVGSAYGAAGSLIAVLVWLYYSAMTFLFGAELTAVIAERHGTRIEPGRDAEPMRQSCVRQEGTDEPDPERPDPLGGTRPMPQ